MKSQRGFSIVTAIFILVVLGLLAGYMVKLSALQIGTFNYALQGTRAYQAARTGLEWAVARLNSGGTCADINAQGTMTFGGLEGFGVTVNCTSQTYSEADQNPTFYRIDAISQFGAYSDGDYVAREMEISIVR